MFDSLFLGEGGDENDENKNMKLFKRLYYSEFLTLDSHFRGALVTR